MYSILFSSHRKSGVHVEVGMGRVFLIIGTATIELVGFPAHFVSQARRHLQSVAQPVQAPPETVGTKFSIHDPCNGDITGYFYRSRNQGFVSLKLDSCKATGNLPFQIEIREAELRHLADFFERQVASTRNLRGTHEIKCFRHRNGFLGVYLQMGKIILKTGEIDFELTEFPFRFVESARAFIANPLTFTETYTGAKIGFLWGAQLYGMPEFRGKIGPLTKNGIAVEGFAELIVFYRPFSKPHSLDCGVANLSIAQLTWLIEFFESYFTV